MCLTCNPEDDGVGGRMRLVGVEGTCCPTSWGLIIWVFQSCESPWDHDWLNEKY